MKTALCAARIALLSTSFAAALAPQAARATDINQTFTFKTIPGYGAGSALPPPVNLFNSALGTLSSWSFDGEATATFDSSSPTTDNTVEYILTVNGFTSSAIAECDSGLTCHVFLPDGGSFGLDAFTGTGTFEPQIQVLSTGTTPFGVTSTFETFTLTYTYTPAVATVPEPSTWAMMALGFAGLASSAIARHAFRR